MVSGGVKAALPGEETCDGRDEDCDWRIDELVPTTAVACGVGACAVGEQQCVDGAMSVFSVSPESLALRAVMASIMIAMA